MTTRRSFLTMLCAIPVPFLFGRLRNVFPKNLQQEFRKDGFVVWEGKNDKFYDLFVDNDGNYIDGTELRPFIDWTPQHPEQPRWARFNYKPLPLTSNQYPRGYRQVITTYLDEEIHPVLDGQNFAPVPFKGKIGESFKFKSDWS